MSKGLGESTDEITGTNFVTVEESGTTHNLFLDQFLSLVLLF